MSAVCWTARPDRKDLKRVYQILTGELGENLELGAMHLAEYGDPRALPLLSAAIEFCRVSP